MNAFIAIVRRDLLLAAQRAVREDLDLDLAAALLADDVDEFLGTQALRMVDRIDDRELEVALLDVGGEPLAGRQTQRGNDRQRSKQFANKLRFHDRSLSCRKKHACGTSAATPVRRRFAGHPLVLFGY